VTSKRQDRGSLPRQQDFAVTRGGPLSARRRLADVAVGKVVEVS
jgi:hypothetical protein